MAAVLLQVPGHNYDLHVVCGALCRIVQCKQVEGTRHLQAVESRVQSMQLGIAANLEAALMAGPGEHAVQSQLCLKARRKLKLLLHLCQLLMLAAPRTAPGSGPYPGMPGRAQAGSAPVSSGPTRPPS